MLGLFLRVLVSFCLVSVTAEINREEEDKLLLVPDSHLGSPVNTLSFLDVQSGIHSPELIIELIILQPDDTGWYVKAVVPIAFKHYFLRQLPIPKFIWSIILKV